MRMAQESQNEPNEGRRPRTSCMTSLAASGVCPVWFVAPALIRLVLGSRGPNGSWVLRGFPVLYRRQRSRIRCVSACTRSRASTRLIPDISNSSYRVSRCRTDAATASPIASESSSRPAAVRPTRPLPRAPVWRAISRARCPGQPGKSRSISRAILSWRSRSSAAHRASSRCRRLARASSSTRHSCSARSSAASSMRIPCRS